MSSLSVPDNNSFYYSQLKIKTQVFPGGTDSRYIRAVNTRVISAHAIIFNNFAFQAGIPAIGFSPIDHTPILLHDHDEFLKADTYLRGIDIYKRLLPKIANV